MWRFVVMSEGALRRLAFCMFCLIGGLIFASGAYAQSCPAFTPYPDSSIRVLTYDMPASITIRPSDPVNTVLISKTVSFPSMTVAECGPRTASLVLDTGSGSVSNGVFSSGNAAIGIRFYRNGTQLTSLITSTRIGPGRVTIPATTFRMEYIKLSQPTTSFTLRGNWIRASFNTVGSFHANVHEWGASAANSQTRVIAATPTCTVSTRSVAIDLGAVAASSLTSVGSVSPTSGTQNVSLSCSNNPSVIMTMSGARSGTLPNVLALTSASTARGVGVQILRNNAALTIGSGVFVSSGAGATLTVPIAARYYRTGDIAAGTANASATLQFTYN